MSFAPIKIPCRHIGKSGLLIGKKERYGRTLISFRFCHDVLERVGWNRATRIAPFCDLEKRLLAFVSTSSRDSNARSLEYQGGHTLTVRFQRMEQFAELFPDTFDPFRIRTDEMEIDRHAGRVELRVPTWITLARIVESMTT